jgi:hypothetical protein
MAWKKRNGGRTLAGGNSFPNDPLARRNSPDAQHSSVQRRLSLRFGKRVWRSIAGTFMVAMVGGVICLIAGQNVIGASLIGIGVLIWLVVPIWIVGAILFALIRAGILQLTGRAPVQAAPAASMTLSPETAHVASELDRIRQDFAAQRRTRLLVAMPLGIAVGGYTAWEILRANPGNYIATVLVFLVIVAVTHFLATSSIETKYTAAFKQHMLPQLLSRHGQMRVSKDAQPDFARAQLAGVMWRHDRMSVDDGFVGTYRDYPLEISELNLWRRNPSPFGQTEKRGTSRHCLAITVGLPRPLLATTAVLDRHRFDEGAVSHDASLHSVSLEDPVFGEVYSVHSTDEIGARVLLTPAVMNRMLSAADSANFLPPALLADGNRLQFVLQFYADMPMFEPPGVAIPMSHHLALIDAQLTQVFAMVDTMIAMGEAVAGRPEPTPI